MVGRLAIVFEYSMTFIDSFGASALTSLLWSKMGFEGLVLNRIDFDLKVKKTFSLFTSNRKNGSKKNVFSSFGSLHLLNRLFLLMFYIDIMILWMKI